MEFYVYDNAHTYSRRNPEKFGHVDVDDVILTSGGSFLFRTDHDGRDTAVNLGRPYVHIHRNIPLDSVVLERGFVRLTNHIMYDSAKKELFVVTPHWYSRKRIWRKIVVGRYFGTDLPHRSFRVGRTVYDPREDAMHCILSVPGDEVNGTTYRKLIEKDERHRSDYHGNDPCEAEPDPR